METIEIIIGKDGSTTVEGLGFSGPACDKMLRALAEALGTVEDVRRKPEYNQAQAVRWEVTGGR